MQGQGVQDGGRAPQVTRCPFRKGGAEAADYPDGRVNGFHGRYQRAGFLRRQRRILPEPPAEIIQLVAHVPVPHGIGSGMAPLRALPAPGGLRAAIAVFNQIDTVLIGNNYHRYGQNRRGAHIGAQRHEFVDTEIHAVLAKGVSEKEVAFVQRWLYRGPLVGREQAVLPPVNLREAAAGKPQFSRRQLLQALQHIPAHAVEMIRFHERDGVQGDGAGSFCPQAKGKALPIAGG